MGLSDRIVEGQRPRPRRLEGVTPAQIAFGAPGAGCSPDAACLVRPGARVNIVLNQTSFARANGRSRHRPGKTSVGNRTGR